jgi:hypothetical protein
MGVPARVLIASVAGSAAIVISGCGGSAPASSSISGAPGEPASAALVSTMQASVRQASSVHISGNLTSSGAPVSVNLGVHRNGDVSGTVSQNGAPFQVIGVAGTIYIKATQQFLKQVNAPANACAVVCGKWLKLTSAEASQLTGDLNMSSLVAPLSSGRVPKLAEAGSKTVSGQAAWILRAADGSTLDVSSASRHYPVAASTGGAPHEVVIYSHWNAVPPPVAPPASQVLDINHLK